MKKTFILIVVIICCATHSFAQATIATFTFRDGDSLVHKILNGYWEGSDYTSVIIDTANTHLWQIGSTIKSFFLHDSLTKNGIMTDTLNPYPINANDWFTIKMDTMPVNMVVDIWHRYQTSLRHDGGVIEFSTDSGASWMNIGNCYSFQFNDPVTGLPESAYPDTLTTGETAFTGNSDSMIHTHFIVRNCILLKGTSTGCDIMPLTSMYLRFRFISDSVPDTLAGWEIDSIKIQSAGCEGAVAKVSKLNVLNVSPNPSPYGIFNFPVLDEEEKYTIEITNEMGQVILKCPYAERVDISRFTEGLYFYKATNGNNYYTGKLLFD